MTQKITIPPHTWARMYEQGFKWGQSDAAGNCLFSRYVLGHGIPCRVDEEGRATPIDREREPAAYDTARGYVAGCLAPQPHVEFTTITLPNGMVSHQYNDCPVCGESFGIKVHEACQKA